MPDRTQPAVVAALPFVASAHEHTEPAFTVTATPGATVQQLNPLDIPAYGYITNVFLEVTLSGGTGGTPNADAPWNIFQSVTFQDVNGSNIVGPIDGYALYVQNLLGGYAPRSNPVDSPWYSGTGPNFTFYLRVPIEISHKNGLGALANQNSAANYKLAIAINTLANIWSVAPSPVPTITIKGWLEAWTLPAPMDPRGRTQAQVPPLLGTAQYVSSFTQSGILVGDNTIQLKRLGNYLRLVWFIARNASGVRTDGVFPDPWRFEWDGMTIRSQSQNYTKQEIYERTDGNVTLPAGVFALPFNYGGPTGNLGNEDPDLWLPTTQSSRLEIKGTSATAGSIQVGTNEVAPIEVDQTQRYVSPNTDASLAMANVTR